MKRSSPSRRRTSSSSVASKARRKIRGFQAPAANSRLRRLAARIESLHEEERKRVAREVNDELGQALSGLKMDLAWVTARIQKNGHLLRRARAMSRLIDRAVETARRIATELRPGVLDQLGLLPAIEWQAQQFEALTGIRTVCSINDKGHVLGLTPSVAVFRIIQEVLTNVARHAKATRVEISVASSDRNLFIEVEDNGKGMKAKRESLGILGIRERLHLLGGSIEFEGRPGRGTRVSMSVPLTPPG